MCIRDSFCFEQYGFHMLAAYDVRPEVVGTDISGIRIHDISELPEIFRTCLLYTSRCV